MPKNPNAKGAAKKKLDAKVALRTEEKRKERGGSQASSKSATRHSGLAVPAQKMEQMSNDTLRAIVARNQPGAHLAQQVLDKRAKQAELARERNTQNAQANAA
jgi:hypothetical protein